MNPESTLPYGLALRAWHAGDRDASLLLRRDDGLGSDLPAGFFFRTVSGFSELERVALNQCRGEVLDVGAGAGVHSLVLQERGIPVLAIDINPDAVDILRNRGVARAEQADVFSFSGGPFDTVLLLGHGIGMVGNLKGLSVFLERVGRLLKADGQVIFDSLDVSRTADESNLAYQEKNRREGRYIGEIGIRFEFREEIGPYAGWLHLDSGTLREFAEPAGWSVEILLETEAGEYLARLKRKAQPESLFGKTQRTP